MKRALFTSSGMVDTDDTLHIPVMRDWQTNHLRGTPTHFMGRRIVAEEMTWHEAKGAIFRQEAQGARDVVG